MIVCTSRRICENLYDALTKLRLEWAKDTLKVVMTGSAEDGPKWQKHIGSKKLWRDLANRFRGGRALLHRDRARHVADPKGIRLGTIFSPESGSDPSRQ